MTKIGLFVISVWVFAVPFLHSYIHNCTNRRCPEPAQNSIVLTDGNSVKKITTVNVAESHQQTESCFLCTLLQNTNSEIINSATFQFSYCFSLLPAFKTERNSDNSEHHLPIRAPPAFS